MKPSSLQNYAREADAGVAFMVAHATYRAMPVGGSLTGAFTGPGGNGQAFVRSEFYTCPCIVGGLLSSDDLIRGIRTGVYKDVSIGFYGGRFVCSIDGLDIFRDWRDCPHVPGGEYDVREGGETRKVICIGDVEDAHLSEVSAVHDGATPGAAILKAVQESEAGRLSPEMARMLEERYRHVKLKLSASRRFVAGCGGGDEEEERGTTMAATAGDMAGRNGDGAGQQGGATDPAKGQGGGGATADAGGASPEGGGLGGEGERAQEVVEITGDLLTASGRWWLERDAAGELYVCFRVRHGGKPHVQRVAAAELSAAIERAGRGEHGAQGLSLLEGAAPIAPLHKDSGGGALPAA